MVSTSGSLIALELMVSPYWKPMALCITSSTYLQFLFYPLPYYMITNNCPHQFSLMWHMHKAILDVKTFVIKSNILWACLPLLLCLTQKKTLFFSLLRIKLNMFGSRNTHSNLSYILKWLHCMALNFINGLLARRLHYKYQLCSESGSYDQNGGTSYLWILEYRFHYPFFI